MNEIQRIYYGSQASPVAAEDGTFTLTYDGQTTTDLAFNSSTAQIVAALEALSNIGVGDVAVASTANGYTVTFQGSLANTNVSLMTATSSLKQDASTVTVTITQVGIAATTGQNEIQSLSMGGASGTTGGFDITGPGTVSVNWSGGASSSTIQTAMDSLWGSGTTSVTGSDPYAIEFIGSRAKLAYDEMTISMNTTDGSPSFSTTQQGAPDVAGQSEITSVTLTNSPTEGIFSLYRNLGQLGSTMAYNASAATVEANIEGSYACGVTGSDGGPYTITSDAPIAPASSFTGSEDGGTPLRKALGMEVVTTQEGSAASTGNKSRHQTNGGTLTLNGGMQ